jgi:hypothetical protein
MKLKQDKNKKWVVRSSSGKVLGRHDTKQSARAQQAAIEVNKKPKK